MQPGVVGAPSARKRLKMDPSSQDQPDVEVYTCNIPPLVLKAGHHPRLHGTSLSPSSPNQKILREPRDEAIKVESA